MNKIKGIFLEGLTSRPSGASADKMAQEVIHNRELFSGGSLVAAKNNIQWLDAITYEDLRELSQRNNLTHHAVKELLM